MCVCVCVFSHYLTSLKRTPLPGVYVGWGLSWNWEAPACCMWANWTDQFTSLCSSTRKPYLLQDKDIQWYPASRDLFLVHRSSAFWLWSSHLQTSSKTPFLTHPPRAEFHSLNSWDKNSETTDLVEGYVTTSVWRPNSWVKSHLNIERKSPWTSKTTCLFWISIVRHSAFGLDDSTS